MKTKYEQIEEMARAACEHFDCDMAGQPCTKCKTYDKHCYTIHQAEILYNAGYRKLPENSLVLSKEEFEQHANEYKNLSIKYDQVFDKYRLCKDANEKLKQKTISASKEIADKILKPLYNVIMEHPDCCINLSEDIKFLMEKYGVILEDEE